MKYRDSIIIFRMVFALSRSHKAKEHFDISTITQMAFTLSTFFRFNININHFLDLILSSTTLTAFHHSLFLSLSVLFFEIAFYFSNTLNDQFQNKSARVKNCHCWITIELWNKKSKKITCQLTSGKVINDWFHLLS